MDDSKPVSAERSSHGILSNTWELELLISGAVVFALMQLPEVLNRTFDRLEPHLVGWQEMAVTMGYLYGSMMVYTLIFAFILHLSTRAYWVGLIGLESVYPHGVLWERLRFGPVAQQIHRERFPSLRSLIVRADRFCSVIFAFAFLVVLFCVLSISMVMVFGLIAFTLSHLLFGGAYLEQTFFVLLALIALPSIVMSMLDRKLGERLAPDSRLRRAIELSVHFSYKLRFAPTLNPLLLVLLSNVRKKALYPLFILVFLMSFASLVNRKIDQGAAAFLGDDLFPAKGGAEEVSYTFYEDQRPKGEISRRPSIQSDVIRGPYVRLFIPYLSERHGPLLTRRCPQAAKTPKDELPLPQQEARARAVLRCLADLHQVALDGKPLRDLEFHLYTHPDTGLRGILGHIPTHGLSRGSHVLRVAAIRSPKSRGKPPDPFQIRFWL